MIIDGELDGIQEQDFYMTGDIASVLRKGGRGHGKDDAVGDPLSR